MQFPISREGPADGLTFASCLWKEDDGIQVIQAILDPMIPPPEKKGQRIWFSVPGDPLDQPGAVMFNASIFKTYLKGRGYAPQPINEAMAVEDARYFQHSGVDPIRIAGALWADLKAGGYHQGGSTITQQLSKMIFLTPEKTITRKVKEMAIALLLERRYSKERILELYLNQVYFGSRAYGLEAAAQAYFGKTAAALSLAEGALLAALPGAGGLRQDRDLQRQCGCPVYRFR